jgi:hypothetical protein
MFEDIRREPNEKPEAIASGFYLSCPNNFEPITEYFLPIAYLV